MSGFDDREKGFESKFAHDQELKFKIEVRRNKLLGLWAAELLGLRDSQADDYAKAVVKSDFAEAGDEDVFRKLRGDFDQAGVVQSDHQIRRQMADLLEVAERQIKQG